jgi:hypothetical protein
MDPIQNKKTILEKLQPKVYPIYGIFDFKNKKLVYVSLDEEEVDFKFELEYYDDDYDIITVSIMVE